jgi:lipopolysaccharide/colanic/teichoic acid biosynthesis glycosyltransferase
MVPQEISKEFNPRLIMEVLVAALGLFFLAPLLGAIAVAIKLDDGGTVFYAQPRLGMDFRVFRLLKFRSMVAGADRQSALTSAHDSRLTRIGHFLRRHKLDELPQLFNVVRGDMQLVGPRPEVSRYVDMFHAEYEVLLRQRPGITDPAALAYRHEEEVLDTEDIERQYVAQILPEKLRMSLEHQKHRGLGSDFGILLRTIGGLLT